MALYVVFHMFMVFQFVILLNYKDPAVHCPPKGR